MKIHPFSNTILILGVSFMYFWRDGMGQDMVLGVGG
jgi:hypothetical protein